jgi:integrase/recombinase XerD
MCNHIFVGPFAECIENHVKLKRAVGCKYRSQAANLLQFSKYTAEKYPNSKALTKEIVLDWCSKKSHETQANQCTRVSVIRQLSLYMNNLGMDAYILPKGYYPAGKQYVPYIFTIDEIKSFFRETEKCKYVSECPQRHLIMPVFFRMIYSCGLRSSEARLLKLEDVDLDIGVLTIQHSKNDNCRLVPMADELTNRCRDYFNRVHMMSKRSDFFFPGLSNKPMTKNNVYRNFRRFLWRAGISHGGPGKGPRVHDFRHAFACHCLKKWVLERKDLSVYLPVLKTYMGHDTFNETAYYLKMTADIFPDISIKLEGCYPDIVPKLEGDADETN